MLMSMIVSQQFQSTLPCGERLRCFRCLTHVHHFNPRSPVGSDTVPLLSRLPQTYFNPRSPVGSDDSWRSWTERLQDFNPRSPVGSDEHAVPLTGSDLHFNPRSPVGSDVVLSDSAGVQPYFNPRSPVGSDCLPFVRRRSARPFQSTLPCRERQYAHTA